MFLLKQQRERRQKNIFVGGSDIRWRVGVIRELRMVLSLDQIVYNRLKNQLKKIQQYQEVAKADIPVISAQNGYNHCISYSQICKSHKTPSFLKIIIIQITNPMRISFVFLLLMLFTVCSTKIIHLPPLSSDQQIYARLNQITYLDSTLAPFGYLSQIYKKQIYQIQDGKQNLFQTCYQQQPQTQLQSNNYVTIQKLANINGLVYDFQQIKYPRNLIDIALYRNNLFYMLQNGEVKVNKVSQQGYFEDEEVILKSNEEKVAKGHFVILPKSGGNGCALFVNNNQVSQISLDGSSIKQVKNYQSMKYYQSAIPLQNDFFAVAYGTQGVKIFSIDPATSTVTVEFQVNKDTSGLSQIDIKDLAYDKRRKTLFMADYDSGVLSLQLTYSPSFSAKLTSSTIKNKQCVLIYYDQYRDELYLDCKELHKYRIDEWPIITQKVMPRQEITIREITSTSNLVALVGRDIFQILVADRKTAIYEDRLLDKLLFTQNYFISANENYIIAGSYKIVPPGLKCQPVKKEQVGNHRVLVKVTAECNRQYLKSIKYDVEAVANDDKCVYTKYVNLVVWKGVHINTTPFKIIGAILGIAGVCILIWWAFSYLSFRKLKNNLQNYEKLEEQGGRGSERQQPKSENLSQKQAKLQSDEKFTHQLQHKQIQMQKQQLHDIQ